MGERLRVIVSGMIAADPNQGGATWAVLQYVLGLRELGHHVILIEPLPQHTRGSGSGPIAQSIHADYFRQVARRFDLASHAALVDQGTDETAGLSYGALVAAARDADLLINISGMLTDPRLLEPIPRRLYLDLDPAFNQLWHAAEGVDLRFDGHTHFATVGGLIGTDGCGVPTCGRAWLPTLQPVVLSEWPLTPGRRDAPWTTVGNWRGYGSIHYRGVMYGQRAHSFRAFFDLPKRTGSRLEPALSIHPGEVKDLAAFSAHGWTLADPSVAATPDGYRQFIQTSKGELGIAKSGYVESQCGWFSDRSVCYLASGRPVVAQDTGFGACVATGAGLFAFRTAQDAADAIETVNGAYDAHCRWARQLAEAQFRSDLVLNTLLARVGGADDTASQCTTVALGRSIG